jgi:hypothetical protein
VENKMDPIRTRDVFRWTTSAGVDECWAKLRASSRGGGYFTGWPGAATGDVVRWEARKQFRLAIYRGASLTLAGPILLGEFLPDAGGSVIVARAGRPAAMVIFMTVGWAWAAAITLGLLLFASVGIAPWWLPALVILAELLSAAGLWLSKRGDDSRIATLLAFVERELGGRSSPVVEGETWIR